MSMKKKIIIFVSIIVLVLGAIICILLISNSKKEENSQNSTTTNDIYYVDENGELHGPSVDNSSNKNNNRNNNINSSVSNNSNIDFANSNDNSNSSDNNSNYNYNNNVPSYNDNSNNTNNREEIKATKEYYCTGDFQLVGTECQNKLVTTYLTRYTCSQGTLNSNNKCVGSNVVDVPITGNAREICTSMYGGSGGGAYNSCVCTKSGGTYDSLNNRCSKNQVVSTNPNVEKYCTDGLKLEGNNCVKIFKTDALYKYSCPDGYSLIVDKCVK